MKNLGQKGQAFSVFKLLIAAIVAVFILTFLLQILSGITPPAAGEPNEEAASKIKTLVSKLGIAETTKVVNFEPNTRLSARTIAEKTDTLGNEEVCVITGESDSGSNSPFTVTGGSSGSNNGGSVFYEGNSKVTRKLYIICDYADDIQTSIGEYPTDAVQSAFTNSGDCELSGQNRICIVAIVPAS